MFEKIRTGDCKTSGTKEQMATPRDAKEFATEKAQ